MSRNLKTALLLASVALTTFAAILAKYWIMSP
ncbi:MAG: cytochrome oxidase small assembly protein [Pseudomonadota bacterium]